MKCTKPIFLILFSFLSVNAFAGGTPCERCFIKIQASLLNKSVAEASQAIAQSEYDTANNRDKTAAMKALEASMIESSKASALIQVAVAAAAKACH